MIIIPVGREDAALQRRPAATYALLALNIIAFILFCLPASETSEASLMRSWRETAGFLRDRPYLSVPPVAADLMPRDLQHRTPVPDSAVPDWKAANEQRQIDAMASELQQKYETTPSLRLAYVPAVGSIPTLVTSMFLHAGILHLLGNMIFLFATGPFVEDAFGRIFFCTLYVTGGVVAALAFAYRFPNDITPLVGASGAIAAIMGAYLVRFALSRMQMLFLPVIFLPFWNYRFSLPALVVLPLWFLEQLVSIPAEGGSGVAVTAHVGGFVYGVLFAAVVRLTIEKHPKATGPARRRARSFSDPRLDRALAAINARDLDLARREVNHLLADQPDNINALRAALDIEIRSGDSGRIDALAVRLLSAYSAINDKEASRKLISEFAMKDLKQFLSRAAAVMDGWGERREAIDLQERLTNVESGTSNAVPTLVKLAMLRRSDGDRSGAQEALKRALAQPGCSPEWQRRINTVMTSL